MLVLVLLRGGCNVMDEPIDGLETGVKSRNSTSKVPAQC
jgi:hypothetical protein